MVIPQLASWQQAKHGGYRAATSPEQGPLAGRQAARWRAALLAYRRDSSPASLGPGVSSSLRGMSLVADPSASRAAMLVLTSSRASSLSL